MTFERTPDELIDRTRYPRTLAQYLSAGGRWHIHLNSMLFGVRLHAGRTDDWQFYQLDYCLGAVPFSLLVVPRVLMMALAPLSEETASIEATFPVQRRKPLHLDPDCWRRLCELAGVDAIDLAAFATASAETEGSAL